MKTEDELIRLAMRQVYGNRTFTYEYLVELKLQQLRISTLHRPFIQFEDWLHSLFKGGILKLSPELMDKFIAAIKLNEMDRDLL